jgi:TrmH family RNA methyltransferase
MKLSNNQVKYIRSLGLSKFRQKYENFVAEGDKCVTALLHSGFEIESIVATSQWLEKNDHILKSHREKCLHASEEQMQQLSGLVNAPDILAVVKQRWVKAKDLLNRFKPLFFLDGVQDPGNVGTIIRVADWFGFGGVILGPGSADVYHPKVVQASMGSIAAFEVAKADRDEVLSFVSPQRIILLDMEGKDVNQSCLPSDAVLVLGSEGKGIDVEWFQSIPPTQRIGILGAGGRTAESLNVGVTAGIIAYSLTNGNKK